MALDVCHEKRRAPSLAPNTATACTSDHSAAACPAKITTLFIQCRRCPVIPVSNQICVCASRTHNWLDHNTILSRPTITPADADRSEGLLWSRRGALSDAAAHPPSGPPRPPPGPPRGRGGPPGRAPPGPSPGPERRKKMINATTFACSEAANTRTT